MTHCRLVVTVLAAASALALAPVPPAAAQEHLERYALAFGGFAPSGPAELGTFISFNLGQRLTDHLRVGGELGWYRRDYSSSFLFVSDPDLRIGTTVESVVSTHLFPFLGTADYYVPVGASRFEAYGGVGLGFDVVRNKHFPLANVADFTRTFTGLGYQLRAGISTRAGLGPGAVFLEGFYNGSSIDGEDSLTAGRPADLRARASGVGFRVGFRW